MATGSSPFLVLKDGEGEKRWVCHFCYKIAHSATEEGTKLAVWSGVGSSELGTHMKKKHSNHTPWTRAEIEALKAEWTSSTPDGSLSVEAGQDANTEDVAVGPVAEKWEEVRAVRVHNHQCDSIGCKPKLLTSPLYKQTDHLTDCYMNDKKQKKRNQKNSTHLEVVAAQRGFGHPVALGLKAPPVVWPALALGDSAARV